MGQTPIHHVDLTEVADHDVRGLQVAVKDVLLVGISHRLADADANLEHTHLRPLRISSAGAIEDKAQVVSLYFRHREESAALFVDADGVITVNVDGSASFDPDGSIVSYE